ncbi:hypothetical protein PMAYCL1PPCAC_05014, partial [Pristionchus mayeri]
KELQRSIGFLTNIQRFKRIQHLASIRKRKLELCPRLNTLETGTDKGVEIVAAGTLQSAQKQRLLTMQAPKPWKILCPCFRYLTPILRSKKNRWISRK